jgi:hypothetical protein
MLSKVLPHPAPPQIRVGRPLGNPPPVISSKPTIPVRDFDKAGEWDWVFRVFVDLAMCSCYLLRFTLGNSDSPDVKGPEDYIDQ